MGRPFEIDLLQVPEILDWSSKSELNSTLLDLVNSVSQYPLITIGSGGSFSAGSFIARIHEDITGHMSNALSPLEFITSRVEPSENAVLLISAGGDNKDIIQAFQFAVAHEFAQIGIICAKPKSVLVENSLHYSQVQQFSFYNPAGKDGFLAVNSLLATCTFMLRAYYHGNASFELPSKIKLPSTIDGPPTWCNIQGKPNLVALGGGWAQPALIDLESKFTESGLASVLRTDFRNFAHGRHVWFTKQRNCSGLIILQTPKFLKLAEETIQGLPGDIPTVVLKTSIEGPTGCLDLFIKGFALLNRCANQQMMDPGTPDVSDYGRRIYNLGMITVKDFNVPNNFTTWVNRKIAVSGMPSDLVEIKVDDFLVKLGTARFSKLLLDYNGTIVDSDQQGFSPESAMVTEINRLIDNGINLAIAVNRGGSAINILRQVIPERHWSKIYLSCYDISSILTLDEDLIEHTKVGGEEIENLANVLTNDLIIQQMCKLKIDSKSISIHPNQGIKFKAILEYLRESLSGFGNLKILNSGHVIDVLKVTTTKLDLLKYLDNCLINKNTKTLIVGDQGQCGGDDYDILRMPFGLSVNQISSSMDYCWNLSPTCTRGAKGTLAILRCLIPDGGHFLLDVEKLKKEAV